MDAIAVIMPLFNTSAKHYYVIEGDLRSYFDTVNHRKLIALIKRRIKDRKLIDLIWRFLKAGVMEGLLFAESTAGVPQGGVASPLLANIYLNEFDKWAEEKWHKRTIAERQRVRRVGGGNYVMVRWADDFVMVTNDSIHGVKRTKQAIKDFLEGKMKLSLSEEKTLITHVNEGFDFLGFHICRVKPERRWVTHLRPAQKNVKEVKAKLKALTTRNQCLYDEVTKLSQLNQVVRGWCEYYKHTSLHRDLEQVSRYAWHRYHKWLLAKYKGSRKRQLIKEKTQRILNRERWVATTGAVSLHQWLPSPKELKRWRYLQKGRNGFAHPYLHMKVSVSDELLTGEKGPPARLYCTNRAGVDKGDRDYPKDWHGRRLKVLKRDGVACRRCGARNHLQVHHKRRLKSWSVKDLITLCRKCHHIEHGMQTKDGVGWKAGCVERRMSGLGRGMEETAG